MYIIDGYVDKCSYKNGDTIYAYLNYKSICKKIIQITDLNGTIIDTINSAVKPNICKNEYSWKEGASYDLTFTYNVKNYKSGIYLIDSKVSFIIKEPNLKTDFTIVYESNTVEVYNTYGGKNAYMGVQTRSYQDRAKVLSFHRPKKTKINSNDISIYCEPFLKWIFNLNYNLNIISDLDLEDYSNLEKTSNLIICGHSEYWTINAKNNVDKFINNGNNLIVLSGNTMWWHVRYSLDKTKVIIYKDINKDPITKTKSYLDTTQMDLIPMKYNWIETIGLSFLKGGIKESMINNNFNGYKIINNNCKLLSLNNINLFNKVSDLNNWIANQNVDIIYNNNLVIKAKQDIATPGIMYNKVINVQKNDIIKFQISGYKHDNKFSVYPYIFDYDKNVSLTNCIKSLDINSSNIDIEIKISDNVQNIILYILFNDPKIGSIFEINKIKFEVINSVIKFKTGDILNAPFIEADGADLLFKDETIFLLNKYNFYKYELIGYDANNKNDLSMNMSFIILQRSLNSGVVINCGNMNWCSNNVFNGIDGNHIQNITSNMLYYLHNKINIFTKNKNTINIWSNIYKMFSTSTELIYEGLKDADIRNDIFLNIIEHNNNNLKLEINTPSSNPGLCTPLIVVPNTSYVISIDIVSEPAFSPINFLILNKDGNVINLLNYIIKDNNRYLIYFRTQNENLIKFIIALKNNYKNDVIEYKNLKVKKIKNDILYNI